MLRSALKFLIPAIALLLVGCRIAPVYDVNQAQITASRPVSMAGGVSVRPSGGFAARFGTTPLTVATPSIGRYRRRSGSLPVKPAIR